MLEVNQIKDVLVKALNQTFGGESAVDESLDLSKVVDTGFKLVDKAPDTVLTTLYGNILTGITAYVYSVRDYEPRNSNIILDNRVYGANVQKTYFEPVEPDDSTIWKLKNGESVDPFLVTGQSTITKVFSKRNAFQIPWTIANRQMRMAFTNERDMSTFFEAMAKNIDASTSLQIENVIKFAINNYIAEVIHRDKHVKLLTQYNALNPEKTIESAESALVDENYLKYQSFVIGTDVENMTSWTRNFSIEGQAHHSPKSSQRLHLLNYVSKAADMYLSSDTYHDTLVSLPTYIGTAYWQESQNFDFDTISKINITTSEGNVVEKNNIIGFLHDVDACGVTIWSHDVTTQYNGRGDYTNFWKNMEIGLFNDFGENSRVYVLE